MIRSVNDVSAIQIEGDDSLRSSETAPVGSASNRPPRFPRSRTRDGFEEPAHAAVAQQGHVHECDQRFDLKHGVWTLSVSMLNHS